MNVLHWIISGQSGGNKNVRIYFENEVSENERI